MDKDETTLLRIVGEASALHGYASTCQTENPDHWMQGLAEHLNRFAEVMRWKTRYRFESGRLLELKECPGD